MDDQQLQPQEIELGVPSRHRTWRCLEEAVSGMGICGAARDLPMSTSPSVGLGISIVEECKGFEKEVGALDIGITPGSRQFK
jgi:hypothetical protein